MGLDFVSSGSLWGALVGEVDRLRRLGIREDLMRPDAPPDDVRLAGLDRIAVTEGRTTVRCECDLPDAFRPLHALRTERGWERRRICSKRGDE